MILKTILNTVIVRLCHRSLITTTCINISELQKYTGEFLLRSLILAQNDLNLMQYCQMLIHTLGKFPWQSVYKGCETAGKSYYVHTNEVSALHYRKLRRSLKFERYCDRITGTCICEEIKCLKL